MMRRWWNGYSASLDLTNPRAVTYFQERLAYLVEEYGVDGFKLDAGDRVLIVSDGLSEATDSAGIHFGIPRIEQTAMDVDSDCDMIVGRLKDEMVAHCGGPSTTDDVTILCVDRQ